MAIVLDHISLTFPDSTPLFRDLSANIPDGLTGLVGDNGTGKSTLARILAGQIDPETATLTGTVTGAGHVVYVPQDVAASTASVAAVLGVATTWHAVKNVLDGSTDQADYDAVGTDWDVAERALAACARAGVQLEESDLDRPVNTLSGGQAMRVALARAVLSRADWLILDEPTNNLDEDARTELIDLLRSRPGTGTIVISHDRALLDCVDSIAELAATGTDTPALRIYGGNWEHYREQRGAEQAAALGRITDARKELRNRREERIAQTTRASRANAKGAKDAANKRWAPLVAGNKKRGAQVTQARAAGRAQDGEAAAAHQVAQARDAVRKDQSIHIDLPEAIVHPHAEVLEMAGDKGPWQIVGPERVRLTGANGAGKSTLVMGLLMGRPEAAARARDMFGSLQARVHVPVGYLGQRTELPGAASAVECVASGSGTAAGEHGPNRARALLAALGLRGEAADVPCAALSGGQRQRVALARVLLADPIPRLLILDEPTNDVDITTTDVLAQALAQYGGAILLITHDGTFAREVGITRTVDVSELRP